MPFVNGTFTKGDLGLQCQLQRTLDFIKMFIWEVPWKSREIRFHVSNEHHIFYWYAGVSKRNCFSFSPLLYFFFIKKIWLDYLLCKKEYESKIVSLTDWPQQMNNLTNLSMDKLDSFPQWTRLSCPSVVSLYPLLLITFILLMPLVLHLLPPLPLVQVPYLFPTILLKHQSVSCLQGSPPSHH